MTAAGPLVGARAFVTGASTGIGRAIAIALAERGCLVGLAARTRERLDVVKDEIGDAATVFAVDLRLDETPAVIAQDIVKTWGGLDILVMAAGEYRQRAVSESTVEDLDAVYLANVRAPYALTLALLPLLKASQGQVVFINSSITKAANIAGRGPHAASQHALRALTDAIRDEVNADGVRVMSIYPGTTATERSQDAFAITGRPYDPSLLLQPEDVGEAVCHALGLPRTAEVTDLHVRPMKKAP